LHELVERNEKDHRERLVWISEIVKAEIELHRVRATQADKILNELLARIEGEKAGAKVRTKSASTPTHNGA
jgi:DNA-nicking Smr family endonuclease